MDSSPHSTPGTPRTSSSSPFEEDLNSTSSHSQDDAHAMPTQEEADGGWESVSGAGAASAPHAPKETTTKGLKGKEKARKGPLRLLDLPVDILKEIIHQVSARLTATCANTPRNWRAG